MYIPTWLVVVLVIGILLYSRSKNKEGNLLPSGEEVPPFYVHILPNWFELLEAFKLIDQNGWQHLQEKLSNDFSRYNILRDGIMFTVLKSNGNSDLIYNNRRCTFHSEVDFKERIEEIQLAKDSILIPFSPSLSVKWGMHGYEISITTPESFKKVIMVGDDEDLVKITEIPYDLFRMSKHKSGVGKSEQVVAEELKKNGWEKDQDHEEFMKDTLVSSPNILQHKYFTLYYDYI